MDISLALGGRTDCGNPYGLLVVTWAMEINTAHPHCRRVCSRVMDTCVGIHLALGSNTGQV